MFYIFGWGKQKRTDYGPINKQKCSHCNNEVSFRLTSISKFFSIFFIPIFSYSRERFLICPICSYNQKLEDKKFEELRALAVANELMAKIGRNRNVITL